MKKFTNSKLMKKLNSFALISILYFSMFSLFAQRVNEDLLTNELFFFEIFTSSKDTTGNHLFEQDTICLYISIIYEDSIAIPKKFKKLKDRSDFRMFDIKNYNKLHSWSLGFDKNYSFSCYSARKNPLCWDLETNNLFKNCNYSIFKIYEYSNNSQLNWVIENKQLLLIVGDEKFISLDNKFKNDKLLLVKR